MKKIIALILTLLVLISGFVFTKTMSFKMWFYEEISLEALPLDLEADHKKALLSAVYEQGQSHVSITGQEKTVKIQPRFGQEKSYIFYFDLNFERIEIYDESKDVYYILEGPVVEALYMLDQVADVYTYTEAQRHQLLLKDQPVESNSRLTLDYAKADGLWHHTDLVVAKESLYLIVEDTLDMKLVAGDQMTKNTLDIYAEDKLIYSEAISDALYLPETVGVYTYVVTSEYGGEAYKGVCESRFDVEVKKALEFTLSSETFKQGETLYLVAKGVPSKAELFLENTYWDQVKFVAQGDEYVAVIPSGYYSTPGLYTITCGFGDRVFDFDFELLARGFEKQYLTVSAETTSKTQTDEAAAEFKKYYHVALTKDVYEAKTSAFNGQFLLPAMGRVTTEFGVSRYVNGEISGYRHAGVDIASPLGSPIVATYDGEVVLAQSLIYTGNSIVISHGQGIFSTYFHMNSLDVALGDQVKAGDYLGEMGTTGFSTGSHLHFGISYFNMNLEPGYFIYNEAITYGNYNRLFYN